MDARSPKAYALLGKGGVGGFGRGGGFGGGPGGFGMLAIDISDHENGFNGSEFPSSVRLDMVEFG
jgi:hypothetical protein